MDKRTPCDKLAETCDKDSVRLDLAAIGTDRNDDNRLEPTLEEFKKDGKYPEFLAWWLVFDGKVPWGRDANIDWIESVIKRRAPVLVAHNAAEEWKASPKNKGKTKMPKSIGTWDEVVMLTEAGYKWDMDDKFPTLRLPKLVKATLLSSAKAVDEDLVETIANLKVSGDDVDKVADKDAEEEEGSDKE